jgi:Mrp family chromosome partitioning ATPase/capsular polysaccharide biosynthesis protein
MSFNADRELHEHSPVDGGGYRHARPADAGSELKGYLALLWRRKWIVIPFVILVPLVAHFATSKGTTRYEASAQVLFNRQSANVSGLGDPLLFDPARTIRTQADIARLPAIARRVIKAAKLDWAPSDFLAESSVVSSDQIDLLTFHVNDVDPDRATLLTNLYAEKYIEYRRQLDTTALDEALNILNPQIKALRKQGLENTGGYAALVERQQQLQTAATLQKSNALLVRQATGAGPVGTQTRRTDLLALAAGIILALGLAFLVDMFDTRFRTGDELAAELRLPLLGGLDEPQWIRRRGGLVTLEAPESAGAEMFRILRSTLDVAPQLEDGRAMMVTSALDGEGKSTTAANVAVAMARAGRHVVLIDLDLRRPNLERLFNLPPGPGVTEVLQGKVPLDEAVARVSLVRRPRDSYRLGPSLGVELGWRRDPARQNGAGTGGVLEVVRAGAPIASTADFLLTPLLDEVLTHLRSRADLIVVDGPPLLLSADALTLSSKVDALLLVARVRALRREHVGQLRRLLAVSPATKLGLVVIGDAALRTRSYIQSLPLQDAGRQPVK